MEDNITEIQLVAKFILTAFYGAQLKDVENEDGEMEQCVCIPIKRNNLRVGRNGKVSAYAFVNKNLRSNVMGWTHYMQMKSTNAFVKKMKDLGYRMPYLGNLKPSYIKFNEKSYRESFVKVKKDE